MDLFLANFTEFIFADKRYLLIFADKRYLLTFAELIFADYEQKRKNKFHKNKFRKNFFL